MRRLLAILFSLPIVASAQHEFNNSSNTYQLSASLNATEDGGLNVQANSPRPLYQALVEIRRKYGWTVDYEEPPYGSAQIDALKPGPPLLKGGKFTAKLRQPTVEDASAEQTILRDLVSQYNDQFPVKFRLIQMDGERFDLAPEKMSILDVPIAMDNGIRPLGEELDEILRRLSRAVGIQVQRAGLIGGALNRIQVKLEHQSPTPARILLQESLNYAGYQKLWVLTYEPSMREFGIAIENTVFLKGSDGSFKEQPVLNLRSARSPR